MRYHAMIRDDFKDFVTFSGCKTLNDMIERAREWEIELELWSKCKPKQV